MFDVFNKYQKNSMHRKLFRYMILFAGLLLAYVILAMILFGQFKNVRRDYTERLDIQASILAKEIDGYFEKSVISGVDLSRQSSECLEEILEREKVSFEDLKNNQKLLAETQDLMFEKLKNSMLNADVSGAFILWNTTVNSKVDKSSNNRSGLYLKLDTRSLKESSVIVYRGDAGVGRRHNSMPHRKRKLEYDISKVPNHYDFMNKWKMPLYQSYKMTKPFILPGTNQKVMLITLPIIGKNDELYGICGFEVEQMFFKEKLSQPTNFDRLTSLFVPLATDKIDTNLSFSSGSESGYYYMPKDTLLIKNYGPKLKEFVGKDTKYIGVVRELSLLKNGKKSMAIAMVPKIDYYKNLIKNIVNIIISVVLFLFFAIVVSLMFSRRYIRPITDSLEFIENREKILDEDYELQIEKSGFYEINELISIVRKKMKENSIEGLPVYLEKKFKSFIDSTSNLTPAEMNVLSLLIQGYSMDELPEILFVSKSTSKHHVLRIYKKLNVSSRGELLLYLDMIKGCGMIDQIIDKDISDKSDKK